MNWVTALNDKLPAPLDLNSPSELYAAALYWSVMTMTTIGYGDVVRSLRGQGVSSGGERDSSLFPPFGSLPPRSQSPMASGFTLLGSCSWAAVCTPTSWAASAPSSQASTSPARSTTRCLTWQQRAYRCSRTARRDAPCMALTLRPVASCSFTRDANLPEVLRRRVRYFVMSGRNMHRRRFYWRLLKEFSPHLRSEVCRAIATYGAPPHGLALPCLPCSRRSS